MPSLHHTPKYASYTPPSIQIHVHELHELEPKTSMEAFKCLNHQVTQLFIGETCATLCFMLLIMKQFRNLNFGIFFLFYFLFK
jgi:hypothetical protein